MPRMTRPVMRTLCVYILALAAFVLAGAAFSDSFRAHPASALVFQLILFWLLNEVWYGICVGPGIILVLLRAWKERNCPKNPRRADLRADWPNKLVRGASVVLLVGPHLLYAFAVLGDLATGGDLSRWSGIAWNAPFLAASYVSCCVLFVLAWIERLQPYSMEHVALYWLQAGERPEHVGAANAAGPPPVPAPAPTAATASAALPPANGSFSYEAHRARVATLLEPGEEVLAVTAPVPYAFNNQTRLECVLSVPFLLGSCWAGRMAVEMAGSSSRALAVWGLPAMALVFLLAGLALVLSPRRWKKQLAHTDYFITSKRVFLMEDRAERFFCWQENLSLVLQRHGNATGSIDPARQSRLLSRFFGPARPVAAETDETGKANGLLNIPHVEATWALMESLAHPGARGAEGDLPADSPPSARV